MRSRNINRASARIEGRTNTVGQMVALADAHLTVLQNSPAYAGEVKVAADAWAAETKSLSAAHKEVVDITKQAAGARVAEASAKRRWHARKQAVLTAVTTYGDGSKDLVLSAGFAVAERGASVEATEVTGLEGKKSKKAKTATATWDTRKGNKGYEVQYAVDSADTSTYSEPIFCSKGKFELAEQTPGATIYIRVRALDAKLPTGRTEYTPWIAVMVSS